MRYLLLVLLLCTSAHAATIERVLLYAEGNDVIVFMGGCEATYRNASIELAGCADFDTDSSPPAQWGFPSVFPYITALEVPANLGGSGNAAATYTGCLAHPRALSPDSSATELFVWCPVLEN